MGSLWRKAKSALGFNLSVDVPTPSAEDDDDGDCDGESRTGEAAAGGGMASGAAFSEASSPGESVRILTTPMPTPSSSSRWLFRSGSRSSKVLIFVISFFVLSIPNLVVDRLGNVLYACEVAFDIAIFLPLCSE